MILELFLGPKEDTFFFFLHIFLRENRGWHNLDRFMKILVNNWKKHVVYLGIPQKNTQFHFFFFVLDEVREVNILLI